MATKQTLDPFARVLAFEPGDRVLIGRPEGYDPTPGVVIGPRHRPRLRTTADEYKHDGLFEVRIVEGTSYAIEVVRERDLELIPPSISSDDYANGFDRGIAAVREIVNNRVGTTNLIAVNIAADIRDLVETESKKRDTYRGRPIAFDFLSRVEKVAGGNES